LIGSGSKEIDVSIEGRLEQANASLLAGQRDDAEAGFREILSNQPASVETIAEAMYGLGVLDWQAGRLDMARGWLQRAIAKSSSARFLSMLGEIERMRGDFAASQDALKTALALDQGLADAYNNFGMLMVDQGRCVEAASLLMSATQANPALEMAHYNLAIALKELNYLDEAIESCRKALVLQPSFVEAHVNLALYLLADGQLEEGFEEYQWRLKSPFTTSPFPTQAPLWEGLIDPQGTLLVIAEQGFGDIIQFARYIPFIAREGMRIIVQCPPALEALLQSMEGVASTVRPDEPLPPHNAYVPLLSLPLLFKTKIDTIPKNIPYFLPPFGKVRKWQQRLNALGETIKVGLRWSGNPRNSNDRVRSISLDMFSKFTGMPSVTFISLGNEPLLDAELAPAKSIGLVDYSAELKDFIDTAALMANLDLVISVDTAVLHLAGALGRPAWGLIKYAPHWPWLLERNDSPWYPSVQLFRQSRADDWQPIVDRVVATLAQSMQTAIAQEP
jgi:tetratricopeptide (TPR) repeat protein